MFYVPRMLMISRSWIFRAAVWCLASVASAPKSPIPHSCSNCKDLRGRPKAAVGPFALVAPNLVTFRLPRVYETGAGSRAEPWVFSVTLNDREGPPCGVSLTRGKEDPASMAIAEAIRTWVFRPFTTPRAGSVCYMTKVLVYLREENGHLRTIIPGVTDSHRK